MSNNDKIKLSGKIKDLQNRIKRSESLNKELKKSLDVLNKLFDSAPEYVMTAEIPSFNILYLNEPMSKSIGKKKEEVIGKNYFDIVPPDVAKNRVKYVKQVINTGKPVNFEDERDGRWFNNLYFPVFDENGKMVQGATITIEITEQKVKEKGKLEGQREYLVSLIEHSSDIVSVIERDGSIRYQSLAVEKTFGYKTDELIGRNIFEFLHPDDIPALKREFAKFIKKNDSVGPKLECRIWHKNGHWVYCESVGTNLLANPKIEGILTSTRDVTERKKAEEKYITLVDNINDGIYTLDKNGRFTYVNKIIEKRSGMTNKEFCKLHFLDVVTPEYYEITRRNFEKIMKGEDVPIYEVEYPSKDGRRIVAELNTKPIYEGNDVVGLHGISREITERKKAEEQIRENEEKFRMLSEQSLMGIAIIQDNQFKYMNDAFTGMGGYSNDEFLREGTKILKKVIHPDDATFALEQLQKKLKGGKDVVDRHSFKTFAKTGKVKWIELFSKTIKFNGRNAVFITFVDITKSKNAEIALRKAEENTQKSKNHLQSVIDSTSEIIFTIDKGYKIKIWNSAAEKITGHKKTHIIGKSVKQLQLFENLDELLGHIQTIFNGKTNTMDELVINMKFGAKRLLSVSPSFLRDETKKITEILFVCRDITYEKEMHGKLLFGKSYLIPDPSSDAATEIFTGMLRSEFSGLYIGRTNDEIIHKMFTDVKPKIVKLATDKDKNYLTASNLEDLLQIIEDFIAKEKSSVILLDRIDCLITNHSVESVMKILYRINNLIEKQHSLLLLRINPLLMDKTKMAILQEEFLQLPSQRIEDVQLEETLFEILNYIHSENNRNVLVTHSKIGKTFSISKVTSQKRIESLIRLGLIFSRKQGKAKMLYITEKGKELLAQRYVI